MLNRIRILRRLGGGFICLSLILSLAGCGGDESGGDSNAGENKQTANNTPGGNQNEPANRGSGDDLSSKVRVDGLFTGSKNMHDMNTFKQVALGMHNHHDVYRKFPTVPISGSKRSEKLSWRVHVLPFAELNNEYDKFKVDEPWDSKNNKPLAEGRGKEQFKLTNGNLVCTIKHKEQPGGLRNIVDGSSNTVMLMENPNVSGDKWTQPIDLTPEDAVKIVKSLKKGEFVIGAFFDGSTFKIYSTEGKNIPDEDIAGLFGYKDGKPINDELFRPGK